MNAAADELDEEMLSEVLTPTESSESGDEEMQERPENFEGCRLRTKLSGCTTMSGGEHGALM